MGLMIREYLTGSRASFSGSAPAEMAAGDLVEVSAYCPSSPKHHAIWKCTSTSASIPAGAVAGDVTGDAMGALYILNFGSTYYKFEIVSEAVPWMFGAVGDGSTDDTAAFNAAAAAAKFVKVPHTTAGYWLNSASLSIGGSMFMFLGAFLSTQIKGTATATDLNAISIHNGQISGERLRLIPAENELTGTNEGEKRALFISQSEPNLASTDYGHGPWAFNQIQTTWRGKRTGSGVDGGETSATVSGYQITMNVGGVNYVLQSAKAFSVGLTHDQDDTSTGDKIAIACGVHTTATSNGKVYGASPSVTVDEGAFTPQAIGHEVDIFINGPSVAPKTLGYNAWSGGTHQASVTYAAYGISRSGAEDAVPWQAGFCLYTSSGTLPQPIETTGSMFNTDAVDPITLANIFYFPTMNVNGDILNFPNVKLSGAGKLTPKAGIDFTAATASVGAGTVASKILLDYEEGVLPTTLTPSTSGTITLGGSDTLTYTKIGNTVHVRGQLNVSSVSSPIGFVRIAMPFTCATVLNGAANSSGSVTLLNAASANIADFVLSITGGENYASLYLGASTTIQGNSAQ